MSFPIVRNVSIDEARAAGYRCGLNGPDKDNCHISLFATPELTSAWEFGKRIGEEEKRRRAKRGDR